MSKENSGKDVFHELEMQNPSVAKAFDTFRQHGEHINFSEFEGKLKRPSANLSVSYSSYRISKLYILFLLLFIGSIAAAIIVSYDFSFFKYSVDAAWDGFDSLLLGMCISLGIGVVQLAIRVGTSPLHTVAPPKIDTDDPLQELRELAERTASRLRSAYRLQLWIVLAVGTIFIALIVWSMVMVSQERILYASAFGSGSVAMMILTQWKWQPFDRIDSARRLADNADTLATGLRMRMKTISEIADPSEREKAQWNAVKEYLERS